MLNICDTDLYLKIIGEKVELIGDCVTRQLIRKKMVYYVWDSKLNIEKEI
jgi:hypothetical protein